MPRTSEREIRRRKTDADKSAVNQALSFRLGAEHVEKLRRISRKTDRQQVAVLRRAIDQEYRRLFGES